jgi:hypothetical protein
VARGSPIPIQTPDRFTQATFTSACHQPLQKRG